MVVEGDILLQVVLLHTKLGKPIPPQEPEVIGGAKKSLASGPKINFVQSGGLGINNVSQVRGFVA